ncbi:MAG: amino acid adenylation domain-containing protein, partial [Gordonia sp. (in: high G+C Gram-positive bacteria)]
AALGNRADAATVVQFTDAARWQEHTLAATDADGVSLRARERQHWAQMLHGAPEELALPYDRPRPDAPTGRGGVVDFRLPDHLGAGLRALARRTGTTGFMIAHAAVAAAWSRITGNPDVVLGTPVANRTHPALEAVIGMFTNTVVLRTRFDGDPHVTEMVARVKAEDLRALDHQLLPFAEIVETLDPERRIGRNPLFQTLIQYRGPVPDPDFAGLDARIDPVAPGGAKFDLTVEFLEHADGPAISGRIEFARDVFDTRTVERLAGVLTATIGAMVADPDSRLSELPLLSADDRRILDRANNTARDLPRDTDLTILLDTAARAHPDVAALVADGTTLTYAELRTATDRLARRLAALGVGVDDVVAVDLPRSVALSVAVLAAGRVGAAYLPLDRDHPANRRRFILDDAAVSAIITDDPATHTGGAPLVTVDSLGAPDSRSDETNDAATTTLPTPGSLPDRRAAYLIYTSGSTGTPKAVVVDHRAIVNRLLWMQDRFGLTVGERVLHKTPTGFDVSVWELFWPLIAGATLVMAPPGAHREPARIAQVLRAERITTVHFVPSLLHAFLTEGPDTGGPDDPLPDLRRILCSGEALSAAARDGVRERFGQVRLHNLYGPTEAAIDVTEIDVTDLTGPSVPIGGPVWNTGVHVLGADLAERPVGLWGDLYLSGVQLARGYAGRPGLTATRFVASPFAVGERMYQTGDIARWTDDGVLEYAGRSDAQIKLRGQRIEPGEVEAALLSTGALRRVVCLGHTTADGRTILVAYGVAADQDADREALAASLLGAVADELPAHLIPATLILLDELPVTTNGKLDRRALPDPVITVGGAAAAGPAEEALAEIFGEVLRLPGAAAREDDFFALGGDSIVAITVINRLRRRGFDIDIRQIFDQRTVAGLAGVARTLQTTDTTDTTGAGNTAAAPPVADRPVPLTPIIAQLAARSGRWQSLAQSVTVTLPRDLDPAQLEAALDRVLARHEALRLHVAVTGGVWSVRPLPTDALPARDILSVHRCDAEPTEADFARIAAETHARLDPTTSGCIQAAAVFGPQQAWLVLVAHHLAVDAVSWRILLDDLAAGAPLPGPVTSFTGYADAVAALAAAPSTVAEATRWRTLLADAAPLYPGTAYGTQADLRTAEIRLDAHATERYLDTASVAADFVAAVAAGLARWRGESTPFLIDVEGHGRDLLSGADLPGFDLSETVGWLTALWPVRYDPAAPDPHASIANQLATPGYGYGLARYCNRRTQRVLAAAPHAQVLVNYLGGMTFTGDRPWQPAPQSRWTRTTPSADLSVGHPLTIDGRIENTAGRIENTAGRIENTAGRRELVVEVTWSSAVFTADDAAAIGAEIGAALRGRATANVSGQLS